MKTLFPAQQKIADLFTNRLLQGQSTLDTSDMGTGKTVVAAWLAHEYRALGIDTHKIAVICPKSVIPSWDRELREMGVKPLFILNYEKIRTGRTEWMKKVGKKIMQWKLPPKTLVLVDEIHYCLPAETKVATPEGPVDIQHIRLGQLVDTPLGPKPVTNKWDTGYKDCCLVKTGNGAILTSHEHLFLTQETGWTKAEDLQEGQHTYLHPMWSSHCRHESQVVSAMLLRVTPEKRNKELCSMRGSHNPQTFQIHHTSGQNFLQPSLLCKAPRQPARSKRAKERKVFRNTTKQPRTFRETVGRNAFQQPHGGPSYPKGSCSKSTRHQLSRRELRQKFNRREWNRLNSTSAKASRRITRRLGSRACRVGAPCRASRLAYHDRRLSFASQKVGYRTGWPITQWDQSQRARQEKREAADSARVETPEAEEQRRFSGERAEVLQVTPNVGHLPCYDIEVADAHCFYAEGHLVHNCKGAYTQNSQLIISLKQQGHVVHAMSGTASESPTEMRALGYILGLHSLNKPEGILRNWYGWMRHYGCAQNQWNAWELRMKSKLRDLYTKMYEGPDACAAALTIADLPEAFRKNRVITEPINFENMGAIAKAYNSLEVTPDILEKYIIEGTVEDSDYVIVNLLRARQLSETLKVPETVKMAQEAEEAGMSVVLFLNFRESVEGACQLLGNCPRIEGGQTGEERQAAIDAFQQDKSHFIVANTAAGGTGVNLHDITGNRPRLSLITPDFNAKTYKQVLFRTYRNGALTDTIQKVLVAAGTIEEHVVKLMNRKLKDMESLHRA